ncbi:hypothetical protein BKE30_12575 [Alkanindiges hydrocarboniclasticus]|uniref:Uncharacterized protein n=1 Tax=Alkanindiges hydrocarboniclasticus TaxID=1907941 RepID=A0A1S8CT55_9GAMM|nr:hypothetical protein [Alkanindiges hydrocarboniclasticus]ONG38342.1 hypothetical protein BKE30_12575 [Alkanindiges hydrocarboniclasticus]
MANLEHAINNYKPQSELYVQYFLNQYSDRVQLQFVSALYHGRTHLGQTSFCIEGEHPAQVGTLNADHISKNEYARLISEKGNNVVTYLNTFRECAYNSDFDINNL